MKKIAILQSNYLPWKGVFDLINQVDTFVFLEDVQYTEHDWRNRNKILTDQGEKWIIVPVYLEHKWLKISDLNIYAIQVIVGVLGIQTEFISSLDIHPQGKKDERVIDIIKKLQGDYYLSGPAAQNYIKPEKFVEHGITLEYINYQYPEYKQVYEPFHHYVTILDLIFNCGTDSPFYIWGWREGNGRKE